MRVVGIGRWGQDGLQVNFEEVGATPGASVSHTEMADPTNKSEYDRLLAIKMYEVYDITKKLEATPSGTTS